MDRKKLLGIAVIACVCTMLLVTIQPARAQFVIADYEFPADNGNGIAYIKAFIDGVASDTMYYDPDSYPTNTEVNPLAIDAGVSITLELECWINGTFTGISSLAEGVNIMRHSVVVTCSNGTTIFSQQNFTYIIGGGGDAPMYFYRHDVILDFVPDYGQVYTATVIYELYY